MALPPPFRLPLALLLCALISSATADFALSDLTTDPYRKTLKSTSLARFSDGSVLVTLKKTDFRNPLPLHPDVDGFRNVRKSGTYTTIYARVNPASGHVMWARSIGMLTSESAVIDSDDNVYIVVGLSHSSSYRSNNIFGVRADGRIKYLHRIPKSSDYDMYRDRVALSPSTGHILLAGGDKSGSEYALVHNSTDGSLIESRMLPTVGQSTGISTLDTYGDRACYITENIMGFSPFTERLYVHCFDLRTVGSRIKSRRIPTLTKNEEAYQSYDIYLAMGRDSSAPDADTVAFVVYTATFRRDDVVTKGLFHMAVRVSATSLKYAPWGGGDGWSVRKLRYPAIAKYALPPHISGLKYVERTGSFVAVFETGEFNYSMKASSRHKKSNVVWVGGKSVWAGSDEKLAKRVFLMEFNADPVPKISQAVGTSGPVFLHFFRSNREPDKVSTVPGANALVVMFNSDEEQTKAPWTGYKWFVEQVSIPTQ